ncbi:MAG: hypothetical protein CVU28_06045 [Betaproteobacteria bacterium HGW-Betaproteobacteria-21]|nr:MAG: hypothetical protein CVU28_06045 [Betaproteobacteria bacterium HGW-Betaproteobacteria-21]
MSDETTGERIAKVMARAGIASRRDAEKMIVAGRVAVNGAVVTSPALDVSPADKVTLDGKPIDAPQPARLWLYYKPLGLVTSARDEKGRQTVFDTLPEGMPRVMSIGRLDISSEGLLLLTNDGGLKRRLELPETGWLRKYRVRVNGRPNDATFDPLRRGVTVEGEDFLPMEVTLDRQQGANAWLTVGLREGCVLHVVENWCYYGAVSSEEEAAPLIAGGKPAFDFDIYKLLVRRMARQPVVELMRGEQTA